MVLKNTVRTLIGKLNHACLVVWPGHTFLRRMINLLCGFRHHDHPIRLNGEFRQDFQWLVDFVEQWNGTNFFLLPTLVPVADSHVTSDAAGVIGYGAFHQRQ